MSVGTDPVALAVDAGAGSLYVANGGGAGAISVVSLATHTVTTTISTGTPAVNGLDGSAVVQSIGLSPDGKEVLAVLHGLSFPGDVLATINTSTNSLAATANLQTNTVTGGDTMGQLVSDGSTSRDFVWITDETNGQDVLENLSLSVSDPASQPFLTAVGGTSLPNGSLGPPPTESTWNDQLDFAEGAGGGGISQTFTMPSYQQSFGGVVTGSSGTPCANSGGYCREVPDVSADADPNTGYIVYDTVNTSGWVGVGGTSGAAPLWAAVTAVAASSKGVTVGFGDLNPVLYYLAQNSPGHYLNDVTAGSNDFNAANGGSYAAMSGYDMATGLGTPVASALASGLTTILVAVTGSQTYGGSPTFHGTATTPSGITLNQNSLTCTTVGSSTSISPTLSAGSYTLLPSSCTGATLSGTNESSYTIAYTSTPNDFTVNPAPVNVAVSGSQTYGGSPTFTGMGSPPPGITVSTAALTCTTLAVATTIAPTVPVSSNDYTLIPNSCSGATLSGTNSADYAVNYTVAAEDFMVNPAPLTITASSPNMTYGSTVPTIAPQYSGFVNRDTPSNLSTQAICSTSATSSTPVSASPQPTSCGSAADTNYTISYVGGTITINPAPLTITASSPSMTYGGTVPTIVPQYSGFVNGDTSSNLSPQPTCSTTATSSSPVSPPTYPSSCTGAADTNYNISYVAGSVTVRGMPIPVAVSGFQTYGGSPSFSGSANPPSGVTVNTSGLSCAMVGSSTPVAPTLTATSYTIINTSCTGVTLSGPNAGIYGVQYTSNPGDFIVNRAPLTITASSSSMTYGSTVPTIAPQYSGFVNGNTPSSLSRQAICSTPATSSTPVSASPQPTSCGSAVDPNYTISYVGGTISINPGPHGYWLVGSDGGIFTFGSANFHGSTGNMRLQRPVVGITPTQNKGGYWLVASDGGIFAFGNAGFYGSLPGQGLHPAGSGLPPALNAPIVGMVPSADGGGYFMVASDGGVFAFGDARFEGSCPGIGGCSGAAVSVVPDASGNGYWLVTQSGHVYAFGDAAAFGAPGPQAAAVTSAVRTSDGNGYFILLANGSVFSYGDAVARGGPAGVGGSDPASAIFTDNGGGGYWVSTAEGAVYTYGDAPNDGSMAGTALNGSIIAATGF